MQDRVYVAKLGKAVGLQGHLRLFSDSDFPNQFKKGAIFYTKRNEKLVVKEFLENRDLVLFEDIFDMTSAKKLTNSELFSTIEDTKANCILKENEHFWFDLISCKIYENNELLGSVKDIHRFPLNDYLEIETSKDLVEKSLPKTFLIPHIFDKFILSVDIDKKEIVVQNSYDILENS